MTRDQIIFCSIYPNGRPIPKSMSCVLKPQYLVLSFIRSLEVSSSTRRTLGPYLFSLKLLSFQYHIREASLELVRLLQSLFPIVSLQMGRWEDRRNPTTDSVYSFVLDHDPRNQLNQHPFSSSLVP